MPLWREYVANLGGRAQPWWHGCVLCRRGRDCEYGELQEKIAALEVLVARTNRNGETDMRVALEKRLAALEQRKGADSELMPDEIWLVAANQPETCALLWRSVYAGENRDQDRKSTRLNSSH